MIQMRRQWQTNAPCPRAVSMALAVRRSNTDGITWCGMSRATPEATGCRHRATTHSVLPQRLTGHKQMKQRQKNVPKRLAISMAAAVCRYNTAHIAQLRGSRATLEATGWCHQASIAGDSRQSDKKTPVFPSFFIVNLYKKVAGRR